MARLITNRYNLPDPIVRAVQYDSYFIGGDIGASTLIDSPRIHLLKQRNDYTVDVAEMLDALLGTAMHSILERATINNVRKDAFELTMATLMDKYKTVQDPTKKEGMMKVITYLKKYSEVAIPIDTRYEIEKTLRWDVDGMTIYGTRDLYDTLTHTIEDYKSTKVFTWTNQESRNKWMQQLNIYAYLSIMNGYEVKGLVINAFYKDWSKFNVNRFKDYPPNKIMRIPVRLYDIETLTKFVHALVKKHKTAMEGELPLCTGTDRWASADQFAIKTPGAKKSIKNFDEEAMAQNWMTENQHKYKNAFIEKRPGDSQRCDSYCPVASFCTQRQDELKRKLEEANQK